MPADDPSEVTARAFDASRERRRSVRTASAALEESLARPGAHDPKEWLGAALERIRSLSQAFQSHIEHSEGGDGLLGEIVEASPRLSNGVASVKREHQLILAKLSELEQLVAGDADLETVREHALDVLQVIARHRQRGSDLIYEAYSIDIEAGD